MLNRAFTQDEGFGNLTIGEMLGHMHRYLTLTPAQAAVRLGLEAFCGRRLHARYGMGGFLLQDVHRLERYSKKVCAFNRGQGTTFHVGGLKACRVEMAVRKGN